MIQLDNLFWRLIQFSIYLKYLFDVKIRKKMNIIIILLIFVGSILNSAQITLINGTKLNGEIISQNNIELKLKLSESEELLSINKNQILNIFEYNMNPSNINFYDSAKNIELAGSNLVAFQSQFYIGFLIQAVSAIVFFVADDGDKLKKTVGAIGFLTGGLIQLSSFNKVGDAGENLKKASIELRK